MQKALVFFIAKNEVIKMKRKEIITMWNAKEKIGLHFTIKHTGKMAGMYSLSTSPLCNRYCQEYSKDPDKICSHCYAQTQMQMYKNMQECLANNSKLLTETILKKKDIPIINAKFFRFEAFGDISNETQVINYFNIAKHNKGVHFALWTKNPGIVQRAIDAGISKPKNLQIILSSHYTNKEMETDYDFVDKIFTVYDKQYIENNDVEINCGDKKCLACGLCYKKNKIRYVKEQIK